MLLGFNGIYKKFIFYFTSIIKRSILVVKQPHLYASRLRDWKFDSLYFHVVKFKMKKKTKKTRNHMSRELFCIILLTNFMSLLCGGCEGVVAMGTLMGMECVRDVVKGIDRFEKRIYEH